MAFKTLAEYIKAADIAADNYSAAVKAAGFKSRWDVPAVVKKINPQLQAAYDDKLFADREMHEAFERDREEKRQERARLHAAGRTRAGNDISGL